MNHLQYLFVLLTAINLLGCQTAGTNFPDLNEPVVPEEPIVPEEPVVPEEPIVPEEPVAPEVTISLIDIVPVKTSGELGNAAQARFTWEVDSSELLTDVTYYVCQKETTKPNDCLIRSTIVDKVSVIASLSSSIIADRSDYFILGSREGEFWRSNEISLDEQAINQLINYMKASKTDFYDAFGHAVALSGDGHTIAVGSISESSNATGINGDQSNNAANDAGAVYIFNFDGENWSQTAYIKASNTDSSDLFGYALSLSGDGRMLAVGAVNESSNTVGLNGNEADNSALKSGAVYLFEYDGSHWSQQTYVKASNTDQGDNFGHSLSLSHDGRSLSVGASLEQSGAKGINGDELDNSSERSGAVYHFNFDGYTWQQQAYIKAANTEEDDLFGEAVSLSADGSTLIVGAPGEASSATGLEGDSNDNAAASSGAVYIFQLDGVEWSQVGYVKASNTDADDGFGRAVSISGDGKTFAVGATAESSNAIGINGDQINNDNAQAGAVYLFQKTGIEWAQHAYIKASNTEEADKFGTSISLSHSGKSLAVGALEEDSNAEYFNGDEYNNSASEAGAVYFYYLEEEWAQQAYIKSTKTFPYAAFGQSVSLSDDGNSLAVGASGESSGATGINNDEADVLSYFSGAVYLY